MQTPTVNKNPTIIVFGFRSDSDPRAPASIASTSSKAVRSAAAILAKQSRDLISVTPLKPGYAWKSLTFRTIGPFLKTLRLSEFWIL
jgi:hypothetical protein